MVSKFQLSLLVRLLFSTIYYRSSGRQAKPIKSNSCRRERGRRYRGRYFLLSVHRILDRRFSRNKPIKSGRYWDSFLRPIKPFPKLIRVPRFCPLFGEHYLPPKIDNQLSNISREILKINFIYIYI